MEFIARTVTHPNPKISKEAALKSLKSHPEFKPGTVVVGIEKKGGHLVATLHEPKTAGPPPFLNDEVKLDGAPSDEVKPEDPMDEMPDEAKSDDEGKEDGDKDELDKIKDLVEQIAEAVGVHPDGDKPKLDDMKEPMDDPLPPMDAPKSPPPPKMAPRKTPLGVTPTGSPAFAATKTAKPRVASFDVQEPWTGTIKEAKDAIESQYGEYGYKVKKIREDMVDNRRVIRARVSVR